MCFSSKEGRREQQPGDLQLQPLLREQQQQQAQVQRLGFGQLGELQQHDAAPARALGAQAVRRLPARAQALQGPPEPDHVRAQRGRAGRASCALGRRRAGRLRPESETVGCDTVTLPERLTD